MSIRSILEHAAAGRTTEALAGANVLLAEHADCPYLLVWRALLIQLQDTAGAETLDDVERSLLQAHATDSSFLPALEELAHFYDAISPNPEKAARFASQYIEKSRKSLQEIRAILVEAVEDSGEKNDIIDPERFFHDRGGLHDAKILDVSWQAENRVLTVKVSDLNANFEGLDGYPRPEPATIHLKGVRSLELQVYAIEDFPRFLNFAVKAEANGLLHCELATWATSSHSHVTCESVAVVSERDRQGRSEQ